MNPELKKNLAEALGTEFVRDDTEALHEFARDRTENPEGTPELVVAPGSVEDVQGIQASGKAYIYMNKSLKASDQVPVGGVTSS